MPSAVVESTRVRKASKATKSDARKKSCINNKNKSKYKSKLSALVGK